MDTNGQGSHLKILFTGGGTAGHVNPAIAMAEIIKAERPDTEFLFVASDGKSDMAARLVPKAGYEFRTVHIRGLASPFFHPKNWVLPFIMLKSERQSAAILRDFMPDLVVGTGGYACWPIVNQAAGMGIPTALHESNVIPGEAVKKLRNKVSLIMVNFAATKHAFKLRDGERRVIVTGNPLRTEFGDLVQRRAEARARMGIPDGCVYILSFGGSRGATQLNQASAQLSKMLLSDYPAGRVRYTHATGTEKYNDTVGLWERENPALQKGDAEYAGDGSGTCRLYPYLYDMPDQMAAADIIISRAGAMTISELALMGKAAILVPYPYAAGQHQLKNARSLEAAGAAVCLEDTQVEAGELTAVIKDLIDRPEKRVKMGDTIFREFAVPNANALIYRELMRLCQK